MVDVCGFHHIAHRRAPVWKKVPRRASLDRYEAVPLSAIRVGETGAHLGNGEVFCGLPGEGTAVQRAGEGRNDCRHTDADGSQTARPRNFIDVCSRGDHGFVSWRDAIETCRDRISYSRSTDAGGLALWLEALPERPA